jgi:nitroreductase
VNVEEAILLRRSIRRYADRPVDRILLERILRAGIWAPTGGNKQPWAFIAVTCPETLHQIRVVSPGMLWEPKALICICSDQGKAGTFPMGPTLALFDCAMAAQNMMLLAVELGLGSCVMRSTNMAALREILGFPDHLQAELLLMLGYPDAPPPPAPGRDDGVIHWERYGGEEGTGDGSGRERAKPVTPAG